MPFDLGAFAKGMEPGFMGYMQIAMKKIDMEERKAIAAGEMNFKIFTDENLPVKMRKQAYQDWGKSNKDWNTGIQAPAFPDEYWENKKLTPFFKKGLAVLKNKDYSRQQKIEILRGLETEAMDAMGTDVKVFKPLIKQVETGMERKKVSGLFTDTQKQAAAMAGVGYKDIVKAPTELEQYEKDSEAYKKFKAAGRVPVKPVYKMVGGNLYMIKNGTPEKIIEGSIEDKAYYNAMRDPERQYIDNEQDLYELVQMHLRILKGKPKKPSPKRKKGETIEQYLKRVGR